MSATGRPYDAQMMRDFHASGSRDLAAYAVGDNLGAALGLLLFMPVVALALGSLTGRVTAARASRAARASAGVRRRVIPPGGPGTNRPQRWPRGRSR